MNSFSLSFKRNRILFVTYEFLSKLEMRGNFLIVIDDDSDKIIEFRKKLWKVREKYFREIFYIFSNRIIDVISQFSESDNLQSRLVLCLSKDLSLEKLK